MRSKEEEDRSHPHASEVIRAEDDAVIFITIAGRHCTASIYTATTRHYTTILLSSTLVVSPSLLRPLLAPWTP